MLYKYEELEVEAKDQKVKYSTIWQWSIKSGRQLFPNTPSQNAVRLLIQKWLELNRDTELAIMDRPRNQENRSGKCATLSPDVKKSVLEKCVDENCGKLFLWNT